MHSLWVYAISTVYSIGYQKPGCFLDKAQTSFVVNDFVWELVF